MRCVQFNEYRFSPRLIILTVSNTSSRMTGTAELATLSGPTKLISQADAVDYSFRHAVRKRVNPQRSKRGQCHEHIALRRVKASEQSLSSTTSFERLIPEIVKVLHPDRLTTVRIAPKLLVRARSLRCRCTGKTVRPRALGHIR